MYGFFFFLMAFIFLCHSQIDLDTFNKVNVMLVKKTTSISTTVHFQFEAVGIYVLFRTTFNLPNTHFNTFC